MRYKSFYRVSGLSDSNWRWFCLCLCLCFYFCVCWTHFSIWVYLMIVSFFASPLIIPSKCLYSCVPYLCLSFSISLSRSLCGSLFHFHSYLNFHPPLSFYHYQYVFCIFIFRLLWINNFNCSFFSYFWFPIRYLRPAVTKTVTSLVCLGFFTAEIKQKRWSILTILRYQLYCLNYSP
jgi:hypothetical protein